MNIFGWIIFISLTVAGVQTFAFAIWTGSGLALFHAAVNWLLLLWLCKPRKTHVFQVTIDMAPMGRAG